MKTIKVLLFFLLTLSVIDLYSQNGWFPQFSADYLRSITCINSHTGWTLGMLGEYDYRIYRTLNGTNWNRICSTFVFYSQNIAFENAGLGIHPSQGNLYYLTYDGGVTWDAGNCVQFYLCPGPSEWTSIAVGNSGTVYMVGLAVDNYFVEHSTILVGGGGVPTFSTYYYIADDAVMLNKIKFTDANNIWIAGNSGRVIKFPNTRYILNENANFTGVSFPDPLHGYVVGGNYFYKTTNGGINWTQITSPSNGSYSDVKFINKDTGWVAGGIPGIGGAIERTTNGGVNWTLQWSSSSQSGIEICFANRFIGWIVCGSLVIKTVTGGEPMIYPPLSPDLQSPSNDTIIYSTTPILHWNDAFGATSYGLQISTDTVLRTIIMDTSGVLITSIQVPTGRLQPGNTYFWRIRGNNSIGNGIWSSYRHFSTAPTPPPPNLVSPPNGSTGQSITPLLDWDSVIIANNYHVQVSKNSNFIVLVLDSNLIVNSNVRIPLGMLLPDSIYYWKVCCNNIMGQGTWSSIWNFRVSPLPPAPTLLLPLNGAVGQSLTPKMDWAVNPSATSYRIQITLDSNFGSTVLDSVTIADSLIVPSNLLLNNTRYYWRVNAKNIVGSGPWSSVWHFNTLLVGTGNNYTEIPKEFKLYTNYPNPFNPETIIKFDIPKDKHVKIVIYDIQGKTIQTLLDANIKAGKYEIEWNGSNYPSGIYFYKMETGEYTSVKKMVLLK